MPTETRIVLQGCDDATTVTLPLTSDELALVQRIAQAVAVESSDSCQPTMEVFS